MGKRLTQVPIWMDVTCGNCGDMIGRHYTGSESIAKIRKDTRLWRYDNELNMILCQNCLMQLHNKGGQ